MFKIYLKIAWRNFIKDKQFSILNIVGLATGLTCATLIFLWVIDETGKDKFPDKQDRLYQIMQNYPTPEGITTVDWTPGLLGEAVKSDLPEVEEAVTVKQTTSKNGYIGTEDRYFKAAGWYATDNFFKVFSYPLAVGNRTTMLKDKYSVVISEELAKKLFQSARNAFGKQLKWNAAQGTSDYSGLFTVSGVFKSDPQISSQVFDIVFSYKYFFEKEQPGISYWSNFPVSTFLLAKQGTDIKALHSKVSKLVESKNGLKTSDFFLQRFSDRYLHGTYENGKPTGGRIEYVKLFVIIALMILVIAVFNFINLTTARSSKRMKEIGMKKVLGSTKRNLVFQFAGESLLISLFAFVLAMLFVDLILPSFNQITGKSIPGSFVLYQLPYLLLIALVTGLIASIYPSFYLANFNPVSVLKGAIHNSLSELLIRKGLVIFQFFVSTILIVAVVIVYQQMTMVGSKNLGYNRSNIIVLAQDGKLKKDVEPFLAQLRRLPQVAYASNSNVNLVGNTNFTTGIDWKGKAPGKSMLINVFGVNYDYLETYSINIKEGRTFSQKYGADSSRVILNEAAVKSIGLVNPIGKTIQFWGKTVTVIGVTEDFQYQSLRKAVEPCIFNLLTPNSNYFGNQICIKIKEGEEREAIQEIKKVYNQFNPGFQLEFKFVEDDYQLLYEAENKVAMLSKYFASIAIIISCLGLFGLSVFSAQKRRKEISIRKVTGASVRNIATMLTIDFLRLVTIALFMALPIAWFIMHNWLQGFAYRVEFGFNVFLLVSIGVIFTAICTIGFQAIKAALRNPVEGLR